MFEKLKMLVELIKGTYTMVISYLPGQVGFLMRYRFWKGKLRYIGKNVKIDTGVYFQNPDFISIDDNCWIDKNVVILAGVDKSEREKFVRKNREFKGEPGVVRIGKNVHVGVGCIISGISAGVYISEDCTFSAYCKIYALSHHYRSAKDSSNTNISFGSMVSHDRQCLIEGSIFLGSNTGVALNAVILPGVSISEDCFVTINSVVHSGQYTSNSVISGNPAKKIDERFK